MRKFFSSGVGRDGLLASPAHTTPAAPFLLLLMLIAGIAMGSIVGMFSLHGNADMELDAYAASQFLFTSYPTALLQSSRFFLVLLLAATSYLGVILIPACSFVRGYLLSCSISAMYARFSFRGLKTAFLLCGVPALVVVPCFILTACDAWSASQRLLSLRFDRGSFSGDWVLLRRFPLVFLAVLLDASYSFYLLPSLFSVL